MVQKIIDVGANANDGTGEPLRQAFTAVNDNFTEIWQAGPVGSQVQIRGNVVSTNVTNLDLVLAGNGIGNIQANSSIVPGTPSVYDLGSHQSPFQYIYGNYFVGSGALLTDINPANVNITANSLSGNTLSANVLFSSLTTVGNLITLTVTGNITGNNILAGGNIQFTNASATGNVVVDGDLTVTGNAYLSGNIVGDRIQNGNTVIDIQTPGGNANISVDGITNVGVFSPLGLTVTGTVSATGGVYGNVLGPIPASTNILYVAKNGNDSHDGTLNAPFLTVKAALAAATPGTAVHVAPGTYTEINPITIPANVSLMGDNLRSVVIILSLIHI